MRPEDVLKTIFCPIPGRVLLEARKMYGKIQMVGSSFPVYRDADGVSEFNPGETSYFLQIAPPKGTENGLVAINIEIDNSCSGRLDFLLRVGYRADSGWPLVYGQEWKAPTELTVLLARAVLLVKLKGRSKTFSTCHGLGLPADSVVPGNLLCRFAAGVATLEEVYDGMLRPVAPFKRRIRALQRQVKKLKKRT